MMLGGSVDGKTGVQHVDMSEYDLIKAMTMREWIVLMEVRVGEKQRLKTAFKPK